MLVLPTLSIVAVKPSYVSRMPRLPRPTAAGLQDRFCRSRGQLRSPRAKPSLLTGLQHLP